MIAHIAGSLTSTLELQVLVVLMQDQTRWWDVEAMAAEIAADTRAVHVALDRLCSMNLLAIKVTDAVRYRYQPGTTALVAAGTALLAAYRRDPETVGALIADRDRGVTRKLEVFQPAKDMRPLRRIRSRRGDA